MSRLDNLLKSLTFWKPEKKDEVKQDKGASTNYVRTYSTPFNGEKNYGEIGPAINYTLDYSILRIRSWQAYLESDIAQTILNRYGIWIMDKGLKLNCNPVQSILQAEGVNINTEQYNQRVEARFNLWQRSKRASYSGEESLNSIAKEAFKNCKVGGDVLVVLRLVEGQVKVELIDGAHLTSPMQPNLNTGRKIIGGVETDSKGTHIAYHIRTLNQVERIEAYSETTGLRVAFLVYGSKLRINSYRGLPVISTSLESLKKIERYKEATVGSAEERQKISYFIEHQTGSDGENPLNSVAQIAAGGMGNGAVPKDSAGNALANQIAVTTNKQAFNLTQGATIKALESDNELSFGEFYSTNANIICAAIGIPPNVAFSLYNDSFSASRAATKDWEHTIDVERDLFQTQFYDYIFAYWLHVEILSNRVQAPGYLSAFNSENYVLVEAYLNCRFTGPMFPHIDPVKEVNAERLKLGPNGAHLPLTTLERATEKLGEGDSINNMNQFSEERNDAETMNIPNLNTTQEVIEEE